MTTTYKTIDAMFPIKITQKIQNASLNKVTKNTGTITTNASLDKENVE